MKRFLLTFLFAGFYHYSLANNINASILEEPSVGISIKDIIIVSDLDKIAQYAKSKNLSDRSLELVKVAEQGV